MKHLKFILLAASMIVTMMTIALVSTQAKTEDDVVGASVPPNYQFNSIKTINIRNDTNSPAKYYICDNPEGSVEMTRLNKNLFVYTFTDLAPGKQFRFHFCVNDDIGDRFGRAADTTDYGFDSMVRVFRYPSGFNPPSNEVNLTEKNITIPPDGYYYDMTVTLDLTNYDEDNPNGVYEYAEYKLTLERKYPISDADDWNTFCSRPGDNDTYNRFSGETVCLENDITVSQQAGYDQHDFCGNFDGKDIR